MTTPPPLKEDVRNTRVVVWAVLTFGLAWGLFAAMMPLYNREKNAGAMGRASAFLFMPIAAQVLWFLAGAAFSGNRRREAIRGILLGFAAEGVTLIVLVLISALAHY